MIHRHRGALRFHVLFTSLVLFRFFVLVFHLKQKHEERQRLLHYLKQINTALAMCKCVCVCVCVCVRTIETYQNLV